MLLHMLCDANPPLYLYSDLNPPKTMIQAVIVIERLDGGLEALQVLCMMMCKLLPISPYAHFVLPYGQFLDFFRNDEIGRVGFNLAIRCSSL